jgi:hypothetical protein
MSPARTWRSCLFALAVFLVVPSLSAVVVEMREWHGKQIQCVHGGAWLFRPRTCGTEGYERVFTGTVLSVTETSDTDRRLEIVPEENFLGHSEGIVIATVNQACLTPNAPEIEPGDEWLFYLLNTKHLAPQPAYITNDGHDIPSDGPSKPLSEAQRDIAELRHLAHLADSGILNGYVWRKGSGSMAGVPNHKVVAKRASDGAQYSTLSDEQGDFEFDSLPAGSYEVSANTLDGLWAREVTSTVRSGMCAQATFMLETDGIISGHVGSPDGKPFIVHPWVDIVSVDDQRSTLAYVDANGNYAARGVEPGRYVVGIGIRNSGGPKVKTPVYYPGVPSISQATIIEVGRAAKRDHVDFKLPIEDVLKPMGWTDPNH